MDPSPRGKDSTALEQAVSRAVRDNLPLVQHTTKELGQAIEDFVAACGSTRNANMLPAMLRAQTAAASLSSMLDVLSRLLTASLQPGRASASESYVAGMAAVETPAEPAATPAPPPRAAAPAYVAPEPASRPAEPPAPAPPVAPIREPEPEPMMAAPPAVEAPPPPPPPPPAPARSTPPTVLLEPVPAAVHGPLVPPEVEPEPAPPPQAVAPGRDGGPLVPPEAEIAEPPAAQPEPAVAAAAPAAAAAAVFRIEDLPPEQQELHRRANRHAKVSMQDIYLLRPKDVKLARENKDICVRLRSDIEKARKEYVRRFGPILEHPVDYFYHWMVEVLAEGKPEILGEYPYPSAATRR